MENKKKKTILKIAIFIYLASFLILNWNDISWIFNYKAVSGIIDDFFNPYPTISASSMDAYFYPNHSASVSQVLKEVKTNYTDKQNTLEIPKLSLSVPIIFPADNSINTITKDLDNGVVYYPGSVYPGQAGQIVVLGHSAPVGWPNIKHDWVFSNIDKLNEGDIIYIDINNKQYAYAVKKTIIIKKGAEVPTEGLTSDNNLLTLISCWPPGKDYQRIAVQAELQAN